MVVFVYFFLPPHKKVWKFEWEEETKLVRRTFRSSKRFVLRRLNQTTGIIWHLMWRPQILKTKKKKKKGCSSTESPSPPQGVSSRHERGVELKRHRIIWSGAAPEPSPNTDNSVEGNRRRSFYLGPRTTAHGYKRRPSSDNWISRREINCLLLHTFDTRDYKRYVLF